MAVGRDPHSVLTQSIRFLGDDKLTMTLRAARVNAKLTQKEAAKKVGVSPAAWSKWERGMTYPNALQIRKIEKILNIGFSDIIF